MIKRLRNVLIMLCLFLFGIASLEAHNSSHFKEIAGTLAATLQDNGSFQRVRGKGFTIGTPVLTQPLIFGISMALSVPIKFHKPFHDVPSIVANYESDVQTLIGATSPYFGPAIDDPFFAVNQITGISISDITRKGCIIHIGLFIDGIPDFPNVETAVAQFAQYGFALNFVAQGK